MVVVKNAMEIFSLLDKSNCRKCGEKTCLAFAGSVFMGNRRISECPHLSSEDIARLSDETVGNKSPEENQEEYIDGLKNLVVQLNFDQAAERICGQVQGEMLRVKILGKSFDISKDGMFVTDLHIIPWVVIPLLDYILNCRGLEVAGEWMSFREISGGKEKYALFKKRGEDVLKDLADKHTDFFDDIVNMFDGQPVQKQFESDVSVVLHPFPLVPIMICYWKPEEDLESSLNLYFDKSVGENLGVDSTFFLGTGLAQMFEKIAKYHGF